MDFQTAWGVWQRRNGCAPDEPTDQAFVLAARARPDLWSAVERAAGKAHPPEEAQNALLVLAAHTATTVLGDDERLVGPLERARGALEAEGATPEQVDALLGAVLLDEAFGDDLPADGFDAAFVAESLETLAALAILTPDRVTALENAFAGGQDGAERRSRRIAAQSLCGVAWSEGPDLGVPRAPRGGGRPAGAGAARGARRVRGSPRRDAAHRAAAPGTAAAGAVRAGLGLGGRVRGPGR